MSHRNLELTPKFSKGVDKRMCLGKTPETYLFQDEGRDYISFKENSMELTKKHSSSFVCISGGVSIEIKKTRHFLTKFFKAGIISYCSHVFASSKISSLHPVLK